MTAKLQLGIPFEHTFVINFRNDDRGWQQFLQSNRFWIGNRQVTRAPTIDPRAVTPINGWQGTDREWARVRMMATLTEHCLNARIASGFVIDETAVLGPQGLEKFEAFASEIPNDWQIISLGGRFAHLDDGVPVRVSDHVARPFALAAPLAFAWRGTPTLRRLYEFYLRCSVNVGMRREYLSNPEHLKRCAYTPREWIFQDKSDPSPPPDPATFYEQEVKPTVVAVMAGYRGGSSCVAGVLHKLGISMGENLVPSDATNPTGYFECSRLASICMKAVDHPSLARRVSDEQLAGQLRQWALARQAARPDAIYIGAKYPALACMGDSMKAAWKNCRFVVVDRENSKVIDSILRTSWGWTRDEAAVNHQTLIEQRELFLANCNPDQYIRIDFKELQEHPADQISSIIRWLQLTVTQQQFQDAVAHVRK